MAKIFSDTYSYALVRAPYEKYKLKSQLSPRVSYRFHSGVGKDY